MNMDGYEQIQAMDLPCLITMDKDVNTPRLPSYKREKELREGYLREFSLTDWRTRMRATMVCPDRPPRWSVYSRRRRVNAGKCSTEALMCLLIRCIMC